MADIRVKDLPLATGGTAASPTDVVAIDGLTTRRAPLSALADVIRPMASQAEAEAGTNTVKGMSPLTTAQAIEAQAASSVQGAKADTAMQPAIYDPSGVGGNAFALSNMQGTLATAQYADDSVSLGKVASGIRMRSLNQNRYASKDISPNNGAVPTGVKIIPKPASVWDKGIFQGFCFVASQLKWFTAWDYLSGTSQIAIMRHGSDGSFELCSADAAAYINHGQTLGSFIDRNGTLWLYSAGLGGRSVVLFTPPITDGGSIGTPRTFNLVGTSHVVGFPGPHSDGRHLVFNSWDNDFSANPYRAKIFDIQSLLDGSDGDRMGEEIVTIVIGPKNDYWSGAPAPTIQAIAADDQNIYIGQSTDVTSETSYLSCFSIVTGERLWRNEFLVGKAFAATKGAGIRYELEGFSWIANSAGEKKLWAGIRTRNNDNSGSDMYAMPLEVGDLAGVSPGRGPLQAGYWWGGQVNDALIPDGEVFSVKEWLGPDAAPVDRFSFTDYGRFWTSENVFSGSQTFMSFTGSTANQGAQMHADGRLLASRINQPPANLQRVGTDGAVAVFYKDTTIVGQINVLADGSSRYYLTSTVFLGAGSGSPEGVVSAPIGSEWNDTTNGVKYMKKTGTGNTGWKLVTQAV